MIFAITLTTFLTPITRKWIEPYATRQLNENKTEKWSKVIRVVDGDTIIIDIDHKIERVRLIGIDTPEIKDQRKKVECFGYEASLKTKDLLGGKMVRLESDETQSNRDKYGRLLRYVYDDKIFINEELVKTGYAYEYTYDVPYKHQMQFKEAEKQTKLARLGLWSPDKCDGKR